MKVFRCQNCGQLVYFENTYCERCGYKLGYLSDHFTLSALTPAGDGFWYALANPGQPYRYCANADYRACNWLVPEESPNLLCQCCHLNRIIPNLGQPGNRLLWVKLERAKHRLVYSLLNLGLPVVSKADDPETGLAFDFLAMRKSEFREDAAVVTGHSKGLITINLAEADDAERERQRLTMTEPYRTLLGHMRHEIGHYYWDRLVSKSSELSAFREQFGDERKDYSQALEKHYQEGPPTDWPTQFVSAYASTHPWEDWAETWAHYLHIVDTLETAYAFGLRLQPASTGEDSAAININFDPYHHDNFEILVEAWLPLTYAVNSLNRSMGQPDLYPFVLAPAVLNKLRFIHKIISQRPRLPGFCPPM
ncbi:MAG: zinc-binding metallopeptidase family protein [Chloroflexota bacterium]